MLALVDDPISNFDALAKFGVQAEGALERCNIDKALLREYLSPAAIAKCPWFKFGRCK